MAPVFNLQANDGIGALTPLCVKALKRIFLMSDLDKARLSSHHSVLAVRTLHIALCDTLTHGVAKDPP